MKRIDFLSIFRICEEGIYYADGLLSFKELKPDDKGYFGKEEYENGEFRITFYSTLEQIIFPVSHFGIGENALKSARAKSGSCLIFLKEFGVLIKEYKF